MTIQLGGCEYEVCFTCEISAAILCCIQWLAPSEGFVVTLVFWLVSILDRKLSAEQDSNQATNTMEGMRNHADGFLGTVQYTGESLTHQYAGYKLEDIATGTIAFEIGYRHQLLVARS